VDGVELTSAVPKAVILHQLHIIGDPNA